MFVSFPLVKKTTVMDSQWESEIAYYKEIEKRYFSECKTIDPTQRMAGMVSRFSFLIMLMDELYSGNLTGTPNFLNSLQKEVLSYSRKIELFLVAISERKAVA